MGRATIQNAANKELITEGFLRGVLSNHPEVKVSFTKKDGSLREMICTRVMDLVPDDEHPKDDNKEHEQNPDVIPVWDLEKEAWRSFRVDSVVSIEF